MKLQLKRSSVLDGGKAKEPTPPYVEYGELCVNYNVDDPALFIKDSANNIIRIAGANSVGSGSNPSGPNNPSTGNNIGDVFFNTGDLILYYWDGTQWVPIASQEHAADIYVGTFAEVDVEIPVAERRNGLLLWETEEGNLFLWYIDADTAQWVVAVPGGGSGGGGGGGTSVAVLETAPSDATQGDLWYCTLDGRLYIYYQDANTSQWVDASPENLSEGFWLRNGSTLSPAVDGDDVDLGTGDLSATNVVASSDLQATSYNGGPLAGMRNQIINGDFSIWQRGTTVTSSAAAVFYTADRWLVAPSSAAGATVSRSTTAPAGFAYSAELDARSTNFQQGIELDAPNSNGKFAIGSTWTFSVWANKDITSETPWCRFRQRVGTTPGQIEAGTFTNWQPTGEPASNGFTRYYATVTITGDASTSTDIVCLNIALPGGAAVGVVNYAGVQFEPGPVATPFEHRPIGTELALCQRYFEATGTPGVSRRARWHTYNDGSGTVSTHRSGFPHYFKVPKRVPPKMTYFSYNGTPDAVSTTQGSSTVPLGTSGLTGASNQLYCQLYYNSNRTHREIIAFWGDFYADAEL